MSLLARLPCRRLIMPCGYSEDANWTQYLPQHPYGAIIFHLSNALLVLNTFNRAELKMLAFAE